MAGGPDYPPISAPLAHSAVVTLLGQAQRLARYSLSGHHPARGGSLLRDPDHFARQHLQPAPLDAIPAGTGRTSHD